jgi:N-acetylglucosaminyl-diphospho-decaprenol L-rhamnosyltransferase
VELVVVDNASSDGSVAAVRAAHRAAIIIENDTNVGYGAACNQAFAAATGDYWLLLNPDATVDRAALGRMVAFLDDAPGAAAVGPRIVGGPQAHTENAGMAPGVRSLAGHFLLLNRVIRRGPWRGYFVVRGSTSDAVRTDWCSAAILLVRPEAIRAVHGFDPTFFLYGEDVDLGMRLNEAGWEVWVDPRATGQHVIGASQQGVSTGWVDGTLEVVRRRSGRWRARLCAAIIAAGLGARTVSLRVHAGSASAQHASMIRSSATRAIRYAFDGR